ncbi:MAG: S8 family serine peptidase [Eubacterium sp.]|nr:S8 family serine peptidase [Eubacterium sp.]
MAFKNYRKKALGQRITASLVAGALAAGMLAFPIPARAAETGDARIEQISSDSGLARAVEQNWEDDYFSTMVIEPGSNEANVDGEEKKVSTELGMSASKARQVTENESDLQEYLDEHKDRIYEVGTTKQGDLIVSAPYQTRRIVVENSAVTADYGCDVIYQDTGNGQSLLQFSTEEEAKEACEKLEKRYGASNVYPDKVFYVQGTSSSSARSWGTTYMQMSDLKADHEAFSSASNVTVAVIDSGIKNNTAFEGRNVKIYDVYKKKAGSASDIGKIGVDGDGHGTHVAGIIADATPASKVDLLIIKVADDQGYATTSLVKAGFNYAIKQNVDVINYSMGMSSPDAMTYTDFSDVLAAAANKGIPVCCAAGNEAVDVCFSYPACDSRTFAVSALKKSGSAGVFDDDYSDFGSRIDFSAPGTSILSAGTSSASSVTVMSGTSMASPHVAAACAYVKLKVGHASTVSTVKTELRKYSKDLGTAGKDDYYGYGCPMLGNLMTSAGSSVETVDVPAAPAVSSAENLTGGVRVKWSKVSGASGYTVYRAEDFGAWKQIATVSSGTSSYTDTAVSGRQTGLFTYMVKAQGSKGLSLNGKTKTIVRMKTPKIRSLKRKSGRKMTVYWNKCSDIYQYQIQVAKNKGFTKGRKTYNVKSSATSKVTGKLSRTRYYARIRTKWYGYVSTDGEDWYVKTYYSAWSPVKSIKVR